MISSRGSLNLSNFQFERQTAEFARNLPQRKCCVLLCNPNHTHRAECQRNSVLCLQTVYRNLDRNAATSVPHHNGPFTRPGADTDIDTDKMGYSTQCDSVLVSFFVHNMSTSRQFYTKPFILVSMHSACRAV